MTSTINLLKKIAEERGIKYEVLPSGVIILINKDNKAYLQASAVGDAYYIRYLLRDSAFVVRKLNRKIAEDIVEEKLKEDGEIVIKISVG
ncbi:hypothetical protein V6M85_13855 [Sulfolobus tengchongensis]|uniref:Uncharacterized protein n=1 Tax=Sulfolobus tengchongensis TaxID=207809 RepID=A0AAX4L023_9CREN